MVWDSHTQDFGGYGIYAQRFNAAGTPLGAEFQVNSYTTGTQYITAADMDSDGDFVISWSSDGQDGSDYGIFARRFSAAGAPQGSEFRVNTTTAGSQNDSSLAVDSDGDFVVTWDSFGEVFAQRYNAAGTAQGPEFRVNTYTTSTQYVPSVSMDSGGDFVVTWNSYLQDGSTWGVYAQRYNANGVAQGSEFCATSFTTGNQWNVAVVMAASGDFVVTWRSSLQDGSSEGVYAQRYNAAGVALGGEFLVNTYTTNDQREPAIVADNLGNFVIVWQSFGQDGSGYGIFGQRYTAGLASGGNEYRVHSYTTTAQRNPSLATSPAGDYVVVWDSAGQAGGNSYDIYFQRYNAAGAAQGGEVRVNTWTTNVQEAPSVAMDAAGNFVVTWDSVCANCQWPGNLRTAIQLCRSGPRRRVSRQHVHDERPVQFPRGYGRCGQLCRNLAKQWPGW